MLERAEREMEEGEGGNFLRRRGLNSVLESGNSSSQKIFVEVE